MHVKEVAILTRDDKAIPTWDVSTSGSIWTYNLHSYDYKYSTPWNDI